MSDVSGSDRISIEASMHQFYKSLTERSNRNPEASPFLLMKDVFMWAVALGVQANSRRPLSGSRTQIFHWSNLAQDIDVPALKAIAVAETGDVEVLQNEGQILRIAEEYANAGIHILKREVVDKPGHALWNLADLVRNNSDALNLSR